jgi:hypothetical protein
MPSVAAQTAFGPMMLVAAVQGFFSDRLKIQYLIHLGLGAA